MLHASEMSESGEFTRQGSLRKVLPSGLNKENVFGRQNEDLNQIYKTFHQEYIIRAEYQKVHLENIPGVYVIPSHESSLVWFGVIFVRSGFFENGVFRFTIKLDENFPDSKHPEVVFQSEVFHPVIDKKNVLYLLGGFPKWTKTDQKIWQVLKYIHWIFTNVISSAQHAVNSEALNLLRTDESAFKKEAQRCVQLSRERLYDIPPVEDKHYITFSPFNDEMLTTVRDYIKMQKEQITQSPLGHSWVKDSLFRPLSKDPETSHKSHGNVRSESES